MPRPAWGSRWFMLLPSGIVAAYALLLPLGAWRMDEFVLLRLYRDYGRAFFVGRVGGWGPRPVSEALLWLYAACVNALHRPLTVCFLAALWLLLFAMLFLATRLTARSEGAAIAPGFAVAALPACYFLLARPAEVFYWPAGAAAYVPTVAGVGFAVVAVSRSPDIAAWSVRARLALQAALVLAAWSSELGAMFALLNAAGQFLVVLWDRSVRRRETLSSAIWVWLASGLTAALPLLGFAAHRAGVREAVPVLAPTLHDAAASLAAGAANFARDLIGISAAASGIGMVLFGLAAKIGLLLGFRPLSDGREDGRRAVRVMLAAALLGAGLFGLVFAYWQFGAPCCERHQTVRQCFIALALFALASALPLRGPARERAAALRPVLLGAALLALLALRLPELRHDIRIVRTTVAAHAATWRSAAAGGPAMSFYDPPYADLAPSYALSAGSYIRGVPSAAAAPSARDADYILGFFGKSRLVVRN